MNSRSKFLALVIFVISTAAFAAPVKMTILSDVNRGIYKVVYKSAEKGKVKVSIYTAGKELVFTETLSNVESFVRPYNFTSLPQGEYTIVVEDKAGKTEEHVSYYFKRVESAIEVTKIANETSRYLLSLDCKETDQLEVKIFDADRNLLHEQAMTISGKFSVIYNLSRVKGAITFEVTGSNGKTSTIQY